jgi:hypothetical protein
VGQLAWLKLRVAKVVKLGCRGSIQAISSFSAMMLIS